MISRTVLTLFSSFTLGFVVIVCCSCSSVAAEILECYQCYEGKGAGMTESEQLPVCSQLQNADKYRVLCPNSTMCQKTVSTIMLNNGTKWSTSLRGCAQQVNIVQVLRGRILEDVSVIEEPYKDGCSKEIADPMLTSTVKQCYCRGNLCNTASYRNDLKSPIIILFIMFLLRILITI